MAPGYEMFLPGEVVMPGTLEDHQDLRRKTGCDQIAPFMEVLEVEPAPLTGGNDRHYHPQSILIRVRNGDQHCDIWVSGKSISHPPTIKLDEKASATAKG
jgi:hypothetical protein